MIDRQAVMQAVLGASTAVAGLLLVFQGYLFSVYSQLVPTASSKVRRPYKVGIGGTTAALVVAIAVAFGALGWLLDLDLFWATIAGFMLSLVIIVVASVAVTVLILR